MTDQLNSTSHAVAGMAVTVFGVATGLSYEVLLAGFLGSLCSLSFLDPMSVWRKIWTIFVSTFSAGYFGPVLGVMFQKLIPGDHQPATLLVFAAWVTGVAAQVALPLFIAWVRRKGQSKIDGV